MLLFLQLSDKDVMDSNQNKRECVQTTNVRDKEDSSAYGN